jgi:hypothetical protein
VTVPGIGSSRALAAGFVWGIAFDKILRFGFPMLDVRTYPVSRPGAETVRQAIGGEADGWSLGSDYLLAFRIPSIPPTGLTDPFGYGDASGWDDADGWADFLAYARTKNTVRLAPSIDAYVAGTLSTWRAVKLRAPWTEAPAAGWNTYRSLDVTVRSVIGAPIGGY